MTSNTSDHAQRLVFVSYSTSRHDLADLTRSKLRDAYIDVWLDTESIEVGADWRREIDAGILASDSVIVLLDKDSSVSPYVTYEWAFALGNGKTVIPIMIEDCKIHERLNVLQYIDFKDGKRDWSSLIRRITSSQASQRTERIEISIDALGKLISAGVGLSRSKDNDGGSIADEIETTMKLITNADKIQTSHDDSIKKSNTILWVDDRPNNNIYERQAFESIGFKFDLALSTQEAMSKFKNDKYVAIISDMGRREGPREGYVLLREIRKKDKQIPFFIYAGSNLLEHKIEAQEKGAQGSTNIGTDLIDLVTSHVYAEN